MTKMLSIILIDWSVRESFHAIDCLNHQTVNRADYEIIWVEWYSRRAVTVDKLIVMGQKGQYQKHTMINEGIAAAEGDIVVIADSDAAFRPTFVQSILETFAEHKDEKIVLYLDEIRSANRKFFPFNGHTWDEVMAAPGTDNWSPEHYKTIGLLSDHDIVHWRNYGACFCARRKDIIEFGGVDEHEAFRGFMTGFYELGWRMVNGGYKEIWHQSEFLLHTWHPWVKGKEVIGPHDGQGVNLVALDIRKNGRTMPLRCNQKIELLQRVYGMKYGDPQTRDVVAALMTTYCQGSRPRRRMSLRSLFTRVMVGRVLVVAEYFPPRVEPVDVAEFSALCGRVATFPYALFYHLYGKKKMQEMLNQKCKRYQPDLIIYCPLEDKRFSVEIEPDLPAGTFAYRVQPFERGTGWPLVFATLGFTRKLGWQFYYQMLAFPRWLALKFPAKVLPDSWKYHIVITAERLGLRLSE